MSLYLASDALYSMFYEKSELYKDNAYVLF